MAKRDYYDVLGVDKSASEAEMLISFQESRIIESTSFLSVIFSPFTKATHTPRSLASDSVLNVAFNTNNNRTAAATAESHLLTLAWYPFRFPLEEK